MNIQPPTDSLYKFFAIAGCLIFIFSISWPIKAINILEKQTYELLVEVDSLNIKCEWIEKESESLNKDITILEKNMPVTMNDIKKIREKTRKLDGKVEILEIKNAKIKRTGEFISSIGEKRSRYIRYTTILGIVGLALTFVGFGLWYFKIQIYQDKIIKSSAEKETKKKHLPI